MKVVLVQQKVFIALNEAPQFEEIITTQKKQEILDTAFTIIILNLSNADLSQDNETTTHGSLKKLENLYLKKSLSSKINLKKKLFGYKMDSNKTLKANLDDFKKITI